MELRKPLLIEATAKVNMPDVFSMLFVWRGGGGWGGYNILKERSYFLSQLTYMISVVKF